MPAVTHSIQYAEMFAIAASVALYAPYITGHALIVYTDNLADVHIINRQATKAPALLPLLRSIYATCANYNISIHAIHIPGTENVLADFLSRPSLHAHKTQVPTSISHSTTAHFVRSSGLTLPPPGELTSTSFSTSW